MKPLKQRLSRLENMKGRTAARCQSCGRSPDDEIKIVLRDVKPIPSMDLALRSESQADSEPRGSEYCSRCGALLVVRLQFDDRG